MGVKFIIDSASDVLPHEAQAMGVSHLPLKVIFGEEEFADAVTITHEDFFEKLKSRLEKYEFASIRYIEYQGKLQKD